MTKFLGALCVLGASLWGWLDRSRERRKQRETRLDILSALRRMGEEVRLARTPMPQLLLAVASDCGGEGAVFFRSTAQAARSGEPLAAAWTAAGKDLPLSGEEKRSLSELGQAFGGDEEQLCRRLALTVSVLQRRADETERCRAEEEKRSAALWGCGGALAVILLM